MFWPQIAGGGMMPEYQSRIYTFLFQSYFQKYLVALIKVKMLMLLSFCHSHIFIVITEKKNLLKIKLEIGKTAEMFLEDMKLVSQNVAVCV